jgi:tetratricopeptide (TPR) repeat protein
MDHPPALAADAKHRLSNYWKLLVCLLSFVAYVGTVRYDFVYDDGPLIIDNPYIASWQHLPGYFVTHLFHGTSEIGVRYYRPLVLTWFLIQRKLFGLNPAGWHFLNILLHLAVTYLVCVLVSRLTRDSRIPFFAGLIFGVNPVHIEVAAWVSSAGEMLLAISVLSSLLFFIKALDGKRHTRWMVCSLALYVAALLTKETACMMPAAVFLYVWIYQRAQSEETAARRLGVGLRATSPFLIVLGLYAIVRSIVLRNEVFHANPITVKQMVLTWPLLLVSYLKLLLFPVRTSEFYDFYAVGSFTFGKVILPLIGLIFIGALLFLWQRKSKCKLISFAAGWTLLWLVPVLYIRAFQPNELLHDRYAYLSSIGTCALIALGISHIPTGHRKLLGIPAWQTVTTGSIALLMLWITVTQQVYWANDLMLSYRGVMTAPLSNKPRIRLAEIFVSRGQLDKALPLYIDAYRRARDNWLATFNAGYIYYRFGNWQQAKEYLDKTIQMSPRLPEAYAYRGFSEVALGQIDAGANDLQHAAKLDHKQPRVHMVLGAISERQGKLAAALDDYKIELGVQPADERLRKHIRELELQIGNPSKKD